LQHVTEPDGSERRAAGSGSRRLLRGIWSFLISPKLALALLVVVLVCCVVGVTLVRGARAGQLIFATLWFNALLVLLAVSSAAAFFGRIWRRKLTVLSAGMILFHVSFAAMLGGIVYNRLFFFDGLLRLTEGETLPNGRPESYDRVDHGRLFDWATLRGETTLVKMHLNYRVEGENKRAAYELALSDGDAVVHRVIYVTEYLDFRGVRFFCQKEGYSLLVVMSERDGREIYGAFVPLQSLKQPDGKYLYATGTAEGVEPIPFPPDRPRAAVQLVFRPSTVKEREGEVTLDVWRAGPDGPTGEPRTGRVIVGGRLDADDVSVSPREVRYWVGIDVRYDPGLTVILTSLVLGMTGMVLTLVARVRQGASRRPTA
jgi:cytochrome c biogenesis protein ResB